MALFAVKRELTLQQLQSRFNRLRQLQQRLCLPATDHIEAFGRTYHLPLPAANAKPCRYVPQHTVEYLAGFFDGDGCVQSSHGSADNPATGLTITQTESSSQVLLFFRNVLGGSVRRQSHTRGLQRPTLQWELFGRKVQDAAALLHSSSSCKQLQLAIASSWPKDQAARVACAAKLKQLKREPPLAAICPSWRYLAGFFDAEGCIILTQPSSLRLEIKQKFPHVLYAIQSFLSEHGFSCAVHSRPSCSLLAMYATSDCKSVLAKLVVSGLRVKRSAARLASQLCVQNFRAVRSSLQQTVGNQARYQRLTVAGLERAQQIQQMRYCLWRSTGLRSDQLKSHLRALQEEHELKREQERYVLIRSDIRSLLSQGAYLA